MDQNTPYSTTTTITTNRNITSNNKESKKGTTGARKCKRSSSLSSTPRLSTDPQSVAARERRHRISDRFKILQSMVPGGSKMDTVSMLEEAIQYVKFLKAQIWLHQTIINFIDNNDHNINESSSSLPSPMYPNYNDYCCYDNFPSQQQQFVSPHQQNATTFDYNINSMQSSPPQFSFQGEDTTYFDDASLKYWPA